MKRRTFIAGLGSAAVWPVVARAQQGDRVRRIGLLMGYENDTVANSLVSEFIQEFAKLGWTDGQNLRVDIRWAAGDVDRARMYAKELVGLRPEVILAHASVQTAALQQETRTIPIVFVDASDPVGSGFVTDLARPGGNITGFGNHEPSMGGRWLELLTEIAPGVTNCLTRLTASRRLVFTRSPGFFRMSEGATTMHSCPRLLICR